MVGGICYNKYRGGGIGMGDKGLCKGGREEGDIILNHVLITAKNVEG